MRRAFAALFCAGALALAAPVSAGEAEDKALLAGQIMEMMPFRTAGGEGEVKEFLDQRVFPTMERRGIKRAMAASLVEEMTLEELRTYRKMLEDSAYRSVLAKLGRANAMMQSLFGSEMEIAIRCVPIAERPEPFRKGGEFNAAEHEHFCR